MSEFKLSVLIVRESVPPDVAITSQISDLVIIDRTATPAKVVLLDAACDRKLAGYELLALDIKDNGYSVANMPLEVGCRGVIDKRNALTLETICNLVGIKAQQRLKGALARIALLGSYRIYLARRSPEWSGGELISVS